MKKLLLGSMLLLAACAPVAPQEKQSVDVAKKLFEAFNRHDWKAMADLYIEPASFLDPAYGKEYFLKSREEIMARYAELQRTFPDIRDAVTNIYPSGETVVVEFVSTGTKPDGTSFTLPIVSILTIEKGMIVKDATYYDL